MSEEVKAAAEKSPLIQKLKALGDGKVKPYYKIDWAAGVANVGAEVHVFALLEEAAKVLTPDWEGDDDAVKYLKTFAPTFAALLPKKQDAASQV